MALSEIRTEELRQLQELLLTLKQLNEGGNFLGKVEKCIKIATQLTEKEDDIETDELPFNNYLTNIFKDLKNGSLVENKSQEKVQ